MFFACLVLLIAGLIYNAHLKNQAKKDKNENQSGSEEYILKRNENYNEFGGSNLDRFYIECVLSGCDENSLMDPQRKQKAELLAQKYNLSNNSITQTFQEAKAVHMRIRDKGVSNKLSQLRRVESAEYNSMIKYAELSGREKRKAMYKDEIELLRNQATASSKSADNLMRAGYQKESDWAIMGGIANGIAGPAAGVVAALDTQAHNASIRAQNQAYVNGAMPAFMNLTGSAQSMRSQADSLEKKMNETDEKLISDCQEQDVFNLLSFKDTVVMVSETGAVRVNTTVQAKKKLKIGNFPAVIDGTINAHIKTNNLKLPT